MAFNKIGFIPYGKRARSVEINVKDNESQTIEFFRVYKNKQSSGDFEANKVGKILKEKYNFDFTDNKKNHLDKNFE